MECSLAGQTPGHNKSNMLQVFVWLGVLVVAAVMAGLMAIQLLRGRKSPHLLIFASFILAAGICLLAADGLRGTSRIRLDSGYLLLITAAFIAVALVGAALQFGVCRWALHPTSPQASRVGAAGLLAGLVAVASFAGWRFQQAVSWADEVPHFGAINIEAIPGEALLTDKGRLVPVFRSRVQPGMEPWAETPADAFANRRIQRAGKDGQANCHGWVFTGGQYLLQGTWIDAILADNEYELVSEPRVGDVIVYRDFLDHVMHTGLVCNVFEDGMVLIESKWGIDERYLHLPEDQFYSQRYEYYRRQRPSVIGAASPHLVQAVKILPGNVVVSQRPEEALVAHPQSVEAMYEGLSSEVLPPGTSYPMGAE